MRVSLQACLLAFLLGACECQPGSGLALTVDLERSASRCVIGGVRLEATGAELRSDTAVSRGAKSSLVFGFNAGGELKGKAVPFARGYRATNCSAVVPAAFDESVIGQVVDLGAPGVQRVTLALVGTAVADGGADAGPQDAATEDAGTEDAGVDAGLRRRGGCGNRRGLRPGVRRELPRRHGQHLRRAGRLRRPGLHRAPVRGRWHLR